MLWADKKAAGSHRKTNHSFNPSKIQPLKRQIKEKERQRYEKRIVKHKHISLTRPLVNKRVQRAIIANGGHNGSAFTTAATATDKTPIQIERTNHGFSEHQQHVNINVNVNANLYLNVNVHFTDEHTIEMAVDER